MKRRFVLFLFVFLGLAILFSIDRDRDRNSYAWPAPVPLHEVQEMQGLEIAWQLQGVNSSVNYNGPFMAARNGKVAFLGSLNGKDTYSIVMLDASDGEPVAEIATYHYVSEFPVTSGSEFTIDESAVYLANPNVITKIEIQTGRQVWSTFIGQHNGPHFLSKVNGELQSSWNKSTFIVVSAQDGEILRKMTNVVTPIFHLEDNILYQENGSGYLEARTLDGGSIWETELGDQAISQSPVFMTDRIYLRTAAEIFCVNRQSGRIIWRTGENVLSSFAVSENRLYYLTMDGYFLGLNSLTGEREVFVKLSSEEFYRWQSGEPQISFQAAYDEVTEHILLHLGDSAQLIAFYETE